MIALSKASLTSFRVIGLLQKENGNGGGKCAKRIFVGNIVPVGQGAPTNLPGSLETSLF